MNENLDPHTRLVTELFQEQWATGSASAFARKAAAHARRRRAVRRIMAGASAAMLVIAAAYVGNNLFQVGVLTLWAQVEHRIAVFQVSVIAVKHAPGEERLRCRYEQRPWCMPR